MSTAAIPASPLARTRRARKINRLLAQGYPHAHCELDHRNAFELLVATVLSAQCTDIRVNQVTPELFSLFPTPQELAEAPLPIVEEIIRPTGFYRAKATNIIGLSKEIMERFGGEVPRGIAELVSLPGVGRKTAHVLRGNAFGMPGLTVDTHFGRLVRRWGLTAETDPVKVEEEIAQQIEKREWTMFSHRVIFHGRRVCHSRKAACGACFLGKYCPSFGIVGPREAPLAEGLIKEIHPGERERLLRLAGLTQRDKR